MKRSRGDVAAMGAAVPVDNPPHGVEMDESKVVRPIKAYKNLGFLTGERARPIRILAEHEETLDRLAQHSVQDFVLFFSSARGRSAAQYEEQRAAAQAALRDPEAGESQRLKAEAKLSSLAKIQWMCPFYERVTELAARLTRWASSVQDAAEPRRKRFVVCTGGGPGLMEAANKGAWQVDPARSVGMGISLPFEPGLNPYVTPELGFEFHYFFMRKFMMVSHTKALVACPGGLGTCDELFEIMTLVQTGKHPVIPIVLFGKEYWDTVVNFKAMAEMGTINASDLDNVLVTDDVEAAYQHLLGGLKKTLVAEG